MAEPASPPSAAVPARDPRRAAIAFIALCALAFLLWTDDRLAPRPAGFAPGVAAAPAPGEAPPAPRYLGLRESRPPTANRLMYASQLRELRLVPAEGPGVPPPRPLAGRPVGLHAPGAPPLAGRAYPGAPPTIPHAIGEQDAPSCLACHEHGAIAAGKLAPRMSHPRFESCTQCHATSAAGPPLSGASP